MKVLITGVAGFIGSNLAAELLRQGHLVSGLDNLSHGDFLNIAGIASYEAFTFSNGDIRNEAAVAHAARGCDAIVHLAAYKIPRYADAYDTLTINAMGSETVARVAARTGAKLVAASTSDVYGKNANVPFSEEMDSVIGGPDVKRWAYAISKMFEEQLLFACHERFGIDVVLIRFFGGYGPHQSLSWWGGPQAVFIENALDGRPLPVHGDGAQSRSFTYVSDHVDGIMSILQSEHANMVVNLGSTDEITIRDLARLIWQLVNGNDDARIEEVPYADFGKYEDVRRRVPDLSRAHALFGFEPRIDLETGLERTIAWQIGRRTILSERRAALGG
jgi:UDP-glucose 4-epimerase